MESPVDFTALVTGLARSARQAALRLGVTSTAARNAALLDLADRLLASGEEILAANATDLAQARARSLPAPQVERLTLTPGRLAAMAAGVRQIAALPDPVGEIIETLHPPNGLDIRKVRVPLGVIAIIYESRPNVTIDCAALCLKSGNACILRGGSEAFASNTALAALVRASLATAGLDSAAVQILPTPDRAALTALLRQDAFIQCVIPRGGESLIRFVAENSTIPVIKHYQGVCALYVHADADPDLALRLALNAKVQRPSVCNAIENLFVHEDLAETLWPVLARALTAAGVGLRVDGARAQAALAAAGIPFSPATEADFYAEFLDLILAVRLVPGLDAAIDAIHTYGSAHSDAIVTRDPAVAEAFLQRVDSATVYWNASTRFTDGGEFGFGAEIGISTDRLHARGPMGLRELCSYKFKIYGAGQARS